MSPNEKRWLESLHRTYDCCSLCGKAAPFSVRYEGHVLQGGKRITPIPALPSGWGGPFDGDGLGILCPFCRCQRALDRLLDYRDRKETR